jgi:hypothetical protein
VIAPPAPAPATIAFPGWHCPRRSCRTGTAHRRPPRRRSSSPSAALSARHRLALRAARGATGGRAARDDARWHGPTGALV